VTRTRSLAVLLGGVLLAGVLPALAFVTTSGTGQGSATTGTMQTVTVAAFVGGDTPSSALSPGGPVADVILRATNPNAFSVMVDSITGGGPITADPGHAGCTTTGVTFTAPVSPDITLPPGSTLLHLAGAAAMDATSLPACQGATFHIPVTLVVHR